MPGIKKAPEGKLSKREYAESVPCNPKTLEKAIKRGELSEQSYDGVYIIKEEADKEWGDGYREKAGLKRRGSAPLVNTVKDEVTFTPEPVQELRKDAVQEATDEGITSWTGGPVPTTLPFKEALRVNEILKAEGNRLKNDELMSLLVRRSNVDKQLQVAGMEIRKTFERLPARVVDAVLGAKSRPGALQALEDEVMKTLEGMGELIIKAITNNATDEENGDA